jgi:hypothetical protein
MYTEARRGRGEDFLQEETEVTEKSCLRVDFGFPILILILIIILICFGSTTAAGERHRTKAHLSAACLNDLRPWLRGDRPVSHGTPVASSAATSEAFRVSFTTFIVGGS